MTLQELKNHVDTALEYKTIDPHPLAVARKTVVDAENKRKRVFSEQFLATDGTVATKEAIATVSFAYIKAQEEEAEAIQNLEQQKITMSRAENIFELYNIETANARHSIR